MSEFLHGELFEATFDTLQGKVGLLAEVSIEGGTLHLKDIVVEPIKHGRLAIGSREVLAAQAQLIAKAQAAGFITLRISGERLTGANPGRQVELIIDLSE